MSPPCQKIFVEKVKAAIIASELVCANLPSITKMFLKCLQESGKGKTFFKEMEAKPPDLFGKENHFF